MSAPEPAPERQPETPFAAPWEAQVFALTVKLHERGVFTWSEWTHVLGAELHAMPERPYYESWLAALEKIAQGHGVMNEPERLARIAAWDRAAKATPHGQPIRLENGAGADGPSFDFSPV